MLWILIALVVVGVIAYRFRVPLLAKVLGQPQSRIQRQIDRRKER